MPEKWKLEPKEVRQSSSSSSSGQSGQFSRRLKTTSSKITLPHFPSGLQVEEEILAGNYSKKEMIQLRKDAYQRLFMALEEKVAKHLRVSGR